MKFEELKAIAAARTEGDWRIHEKWHDTIVNSSDETCIEVSAFTDANLKFIAMAANYIDKLIAVAEAAKDVELEEYKEDGKIEPKLSRLYNALAALEAAP